MVQKLQCCVAAFGWFVGCNIYFASCQKGLVHVFSPRTPINHEFSSWLSLHVSTLFKHFCYTNQSI